MSSLDPALCGCRYAHGSKWNYPPGHRRNCFRYDPGGFTGLGQSSCLSCYFGYAPTSCETSMSLFNDSYPFGFTPRNSGTFAPVFGHSSHPFGFNSTSGGTSAPAFEYNNHRFGSTPSNIGTSVPGQNCANPFGRASANGGTSVPTFGQNSTTTFGCASANGGTFVPTFDQNSAISFGCAPANGGTSGSAFGKNSTTPFGCASANIGTSVPAFGQNSTTPFGCASVPTFGQNSTTSFGCAPANGGTSLPTFGQSSTVCGCAPANGGSASTNSLGFTPSNTTLLPASQRSKLLGSVPTNGGTPATTFGENINYFASALTNGGSSVPACRAPISSTLMQPASSSPVGGSFSGSTSFFQTPAVIASSSPGFGSGCTMTCSQPTLPSGASSLFGTGPYPFGTQNHLSGSTTHFQTPTTDASSSPGFSFGCTTSGQATTQFGTSNTFFGNCIWSGKIQVPFFGDQVKTPVFGDPSSGPLTYSVNRGGSRVTPYTETVEQEAGSQLSTRLMSISAMPVFRDKCHEELRWEDKQLGYNGNIPLFHSIRSGQSVIGSQSKGSKVKPYTKTMVGEDCTTATSISAMPAQDKSHEELRWEDHQFNNAGGGVDPASAQLNCFWNPVSRTGSSCLKSVPSSIPPSIFASSPPYFTFPTCSTPFTSSSFLSDSCGGACASMTETPSIFGPAITFSHPNPSIISSSACEASTSRPSLFNYTSSAPCASICRMAVTAPVTASVPCNFPPSISTVDAVSPSRYRAETPPAVPQMIAEGPKDTSVRYGISNIPVKHSANEEKKQLLTPKCNRQGDGPEVSFSADAHETPTTARKNVTLLSKDNSGDLISGPSEEWTLKINFKNISLKHTSIHVYENGEVSVELSKPLVDGFLQDKVGNPGETFAAEHSLKPNFMNGNPSIKKVPSNVSWLLPKLKHSDYFIQPQVEELAIKEIHEPGFCSHVKDFVVGHKHHGCIKFLGETDVRQLDVNSHIVFRNGEVILSMDENKDSPVGQCLNKAAEITLCNIKCVDKAGNQYINGPKVDKYEKKLMKKAAEQGAEFVSYDPVQGEWKFRVKHL